MEKQGKRNSIQLGNKKVDTIFGTCKHTLQKNMQQPLPESLSTS